MALWQPASVILECLCYIVCVSEANKYSQSVSPCTTKLSLSLSITLICCRTCSLHLSAAVHAIITRFMILAGLLSTKCCRRSSFFPSCRCYVCIYTPTSVRALVSVWLSALSNTRKQLTLYWRLPSVWNSERTEPTNKSYKVNICSRWRKKRPIGYCESKRCYHALVLHIANSCTITQLCLFSDFITFITVTALKHRRMIFSGNSHCLQV